ncbi:MAG TPA: hypothetical protein PKL31_17830 [Fulvivirga sp.]|nr:hypothetical protein [Fulvivirga sp.]
MKALIILYLSIISLNAICQNQDNYDLLIASGGIPFSSFYEINNEGNNNRTDSFYYYNDWQKADLYLKSKMITLPCRFNIQRGLLEVKWNKNNLVLTSKNIDSVLFKEANTVFVYEQMLRSLVQVVVNGEFKLLKEFTLKTNKADYNPSLNIGNKYDSYSVIYQYYIKHNNSVCLISNRKSIKGCLSNIGFSRNDFKKIRMNEASLKELTQQLNN